MCKPSAQGCARTRSNARVCLLSPQVGSLLDGRVLRHLVVRPAGHCTPQTRSAKVIVPSREGDRAQFCVNHDRKCGYSSEQGEEVLLRVAVLRAFCFALQRPVGGVLERKGRKVGRRRSRLRRQALLPGFDEVENYGEDVVEMAKELLEVFKAPSARGRGCQRISI